MFFLWVFFKYPLLFFDYTEVNEFTLYDKYSTSKISYELVWIKEWSLPFTLCQTYISILKNWSVSAQRSRLTGTIITRYNRRFIGVKLLLVNGRKIQAVVNTKHKTFEVFVLSHIAIESILSYMKTFLGVPSSTWR